MLYLVKGTHRRCGSKTVDNFCLHNSEFNLNHYFRNENDLAYYLADNHCSELDDITNIIPHKTQKKIEKEGFIIKRMLENDEIRFFKEKIKNLIY